MPDLRGGEPTSLSRGDLATIESEIDKDGTPVTLEAGSWLVCFVPGLFKQWWQPFVHMVHKHVFTLRPAGPGERTLFEPWWTQLLTAAITSDQARKFLIWGARGDVLLVREAIPGRGSQVRGWMNCAGLSSYLLGRRSTRELQTAIRNFIHHHNRDPKPFAWHKTADQILDSVARFCTRTFRLRTLEAVS